LILAALLLAAAPAPPSALERLTKEVVRPLETGFEGPIGVYVEGSPAPASRAIGSLVMSALAQKKLAPVPIEAKDATEAERLAREQGLRTLVRLTVSFEAPRLTVRGDALSTWVNFWSGQTPTRTGPAAAIAATVDADLEALTLAGSGSTPTPNTRPLELAMGVVARAPGWPAAFTLADVDGDKKCEVIALIDDVVSTWSSDGKLRSRVELSGPQSAHPTREPFGFLSFNGGKLQAWSSRRERAENFTWERNGFRTAGSSDALSIGALTLTPRAGFASFARELQWAGKNVVWPEPLQSVSTFGPIALGVGPAGNAGVSRGTAPASLLSGVGAGSTLADFDGDGAPEVIVTGPRTTAEGDEVRVLSLGAFESAQVRSGSINETSAVWTRKLDGRVILAANGDLDGDGVDEVVLVSWLADGSSEFSVLRRAP
jgi:hypothetical protein